MDIQAIDTPALMHAPLLIGLQDKVLENEVVQQMKHFGYPHSTFTNLRELLDITNDTHKHFSVILLDLQYCTQHPPQLLTTLSERIPIIFISNHHDVASRLFAVKAGGKAYLTTPFEFTTLIDKIDQVAPESEMTPLRILIIEDSKTQANVIRAHLENAHMLTHILSDPLQVCDVLTEFQPDLILLDLYMPLCSGMELARMIRQQDLFVSIPIVYLSAEENLYKQLNAIQHGGDDFLTKPLAPEHLITSVKTRAKRYRLLRASMTQDSLTGLLNHTRILEQLDLEIARAHRNKTTLHFAMLDIDHFKNVNDSYGHPVGDHVIKALARLLKQHLRKTDIVGRYGGEEFAIILPQSSSPALLKKLDEIRYAFSKLLHRGNNPSAEFSATFSVGLAALTPDTDSVDKLVQAADQALYHAKDTGRNCVTLYSHPM